ncbi:tape measure protein [Azospirillum picis]|uniref:Tape measure domain-containing protein n=1 Tax=Azospirillum picis TaxID=488438 RepID=A0ABU0MPL8_9PROT|nr:tape measure protein [Azospirillum picis]MBP2301312.1 tape measure domain-containing protein [Azospirillum picis]MDQ0535143.1 tape measure domain-containing protein [Azospirillum picis]
MVENDHHAFLLRWLPVSNTMKVAFQFVADAGGLVGGIRVARDELDRLGKAAEAAANDTGSALRRVGDAGAPVVPLEAQRRATQGLSADMGEASVRARALQQAAAASVSPHRNAADAIAGAANAARGYGGATEQAAKGASGFAGTLGTVATGLRTMVAALAVDRVLDIGAAFINAAAASQQMERRLAGLVGSGDALAENQEWLSRTADRLGQSTSVLSDSYTRLLNLQRSGLVSMDQARGLTEGLANAQVKYAADAGRMGDVMYGLSQALASPTLHMEELNQVTEPLPGLLLDLDKAAGQPTGGFRKLVTEGRVTSEMFRDTLLKALKGYAGEAERASGSVEAAYQRMENARNRFLANGGKLLVDGWTNLVNAGTAGINLADRGLSWAQRRSTEGDLAVERIQLDKLLAQRQELEAARSRYASGAGGVYARRNVEMTDKELAGVEGEIDKVLAKIRQLEGKLGDAKDGWAQMWGSATTGGRTVVDELAPKLADVAGGLDLVVTRAGLLTKSEVELRTQTDVLTRVLALPPAELKKLGITAADASFMLDQLAEKSSVVAAAIADLNRATATVGVSPKWRDLYSTLDKAAQDKGRPLTDDESADLTSAWRRKRNADSAEQVRLANEAAAAATKLAQAQASGSPATVAAARADLQVAEALRDGVIVQADAASYRAGKLRENMAGLAGQAGEAATASSRQARQLLEMAAATERGGAAVAVTTLKQQIENETLKVGAGAHGDLAKRLTEEDAARRKLAAAQWDRDMDLQIQAAQSLADAEGRGVRAVADATAANQVAAQVEKEGVAVDGERAKAIGVKTAELAKWQERQTYRRSLHDADDDIALLQRELSLQGEGETIRTRTLELARAELDIRRQFPNATEDEIAALLRKHETAIKLREEIAQQRGIWDELGQLGERAFDRIGSAITEAFAQGTASTISWGSIAKAVISEVVQAALQLAILNPAKNLVTGGNAPSIWSAFGGQQQSSGGVSGALTNTALSKGAGWAMDKVGLSAGMDTPLWGSAVSMSSVGGGSTVIATANPIIGQATGAVQAGSLNAANGVVNAGNTAALNASYSGTASGAAGTAGATLGSVLGTAGIGAGVGGLLGGWLGTNSNSKVVGGAAGAASGAAAGALAGTFIFPGVGTLLGALIGGGGGLLGGLLGTQKMSVGPNSSAELHYSRTGVSADTALADNGADASGIQSVAQGIATSVNTIISGIGAQFAASTRQTDLAAVRWFQQGGKWYVDPRDGSGGRQEYGSQEAAIAGLIKWTIQRLDQSGAVSGVSGDVRTALKNTKATNAEDLANDLQFASTFRNQIDAMNASMDPVSNQLKTFTEQAKTLGDQIKTNITDWRTKAAELGLATEDELTVAARRGIEALMGITPAAQSLTGLAAVSKQAEINVEAFRPALASLGYTAEEQASLIARYTQKLTDDYTSSVQLVQRQGMAAVSALTDPTATLAIADRFRTSLGLDPTTSAVKGLVTTFDSVEQSARTGTLSMAQLKAALSQVDTALMDGTVSAEQYTNLVTSLTAAWTTAQAVLSAQRQGRIAVEQAIDPTWRPDLTTRFAEAGLSDAVAAALRPTFAALVDAAGRGEATAGQMRSALVALDGQLSAGTITADQHRSTINLLTAAWADSAAAATAVTEAEKTKAEAEISTQTAIVTSWTRIRDQARSAINSLQMDNSLSTLGTKAKLDFAESQMNDAYNRVLTAANDNDRSSAADEFGSLWRPYLEQARSYYASQPEYEAREQKVLSLQTTIAGRASDQVDTATRALGVAEKQRDYLASIDGRLASGASSAGPSVPASNSGPGTYLGEAGHNYRWIQHPDGNWSIEQYATGAAALGQGVYHRPTRFRELGEAGPEAIMPLANVGGRLGIHAVLPGSSAASVDLVPVVAAVGGTTGAVLEIGSMIADRLDTMIGLSGAILRELADSRRVTRDLVTLLERRAA